MAQKRARVVHFPWNTGAVPPPPGTKSLLTVHDVIPLVLPDLYFRTEQERSSFTRRIQASIDASDCILTVSECSKRDILRHLRPRNEPVVIYHSLGPAPPPPMQSVQLRLGPAPFVYLGGFERRKGLDLLISVHSELFASGAVTRKLVLLGQAPSEASQQSPVLLSARRLGAIVEPGYVEDSEVIRWLSTACALVYPSLYEGFGFPLLEAMAHGCPVITTHAGAMPEVCGEAALYVTPGNRRELGAAMVQLSADETARTSLAQRGLTQAATFSWERNSQGLLAILNRLASSHGEFDDHRRL
ncbi:MAG TPA: glycosyltransferase family 1 protein [Bryobacteraceae bacterium]|nr:glycosyltransferase family 1 protein [Bryobacteraceae bacterium]